MTELRERRGQGIAEPAINQGQQSGIAEPSIDQGQQSSNSGFYQALLHGGDYLHASDTQASVGLYENPLPCCGCGIGWFLFLSGFLLPILWYYGAFLFFTSNYHNDPRERPALVACSIAALVNTVALAIALVIMIVHHKGSSLFVSDWG
ncbi:unnamed protein product [Sphagnum jensenii]|uniref:60S ribosomal protein L18a-like protein n=1 Tax=Sphagnum jensenii TaxID=128206 RepID=A0ABP0W366_9BRYO